MMISGQKGKKFFFNQITSIVGRLSIGLSITILLVTTSVLFFDYRHTKRKGLEKLNRRADEYVELASNALQLAL